MQKSKPKNDFRQRRRFRYVILMLLALGVLTWLVWRTQPLYAPAATDEVHYSPDGRFFVAIYPIDIGAGGAHISDGWRETTHSEYHGGQFFGWSADSRYAVIVFMQHYSVSDLGIFDTTEWQWHFGNSCDMFAGSGSPCDSEMPLATNGRYLLLTTGTMIDLTGDLPILGYTNDGGWNRLWIGIYPQAVAWSPSNNYLALVGADKDGKQALYLGDEDGQMLQAMLPLETDFKVDSITWSADESRITITGTRNDMPKKRVYILKDAK